MAAPASTGAAAVVAVSAVALAPRAAPSGMVVSAVGSARRGGSGRGRVGLGAREWGGGAGGSAG